MRYLLSMVIMALLCLAQTADAADRAITCHGCSISQMASAATGAVSTGTVFVFNEANAEVRRYRVFSEVIDTMPWTVWKQAIPKSVDPELIGAYDAYVQGRQDFEDMDTIDLPLNFPVRSVAGSFLDPAYTTTNIEDYLRELDNTQQILLRLHVIVSNLLRANIPGVNLSRLIRAVRITIRFPDGSTQDFELSFKMNAVSGELSLEAEPLGNARTAEGRPAPSSRFAFADTTIYNRNTSLHEWVAYARSLGLVVTGPSKGTKMVCWIDGGTVICKVTKGN